MTESEIKEIILKEVIGEWPSHYDRNRAARAAQQIADLVKRKLNKPGPPPHYPSRSCDCGAERVSPTTSHANWCRIHGSRK